jgi:hypothetical protein
MDESITQPLSRYVQELIRIREEYADLLFTGRYANTFGATVKCAENSRFSVFEHMKDKTRKAVVLVNFDNHEDEMEVIMDDLTEAKAELSIPFQPDSVIQLPAKIKVPAQTCAVVVPSCMLARKILHLT